MWELNQIMCFVYLSIMSAEDICTRKLSLRVLLLGILATIGWQSIFGKMDWISCVAGAMVGILFLGVGKLTRGGFGYGDGLLILMLGIYVGFWKLLTILIIAFFMAAVIAILLLLFRCFQKKATLPFVPFLSVGYMVLVLFG